MQIALERVVPIPLKDRFAQRPSGVWNNAVTFQQGDLIKIKAPSGTGKTTLIHSLYKLRNDYEGNIMYDGKNVRSIEEETLAHIRQQQISVIFQDLRLFGNLTARENIELNRVLQKPYYESSKIDEWAKELGVAHILNQPARLCSYGEQQRIAIIRALIQPFAWLIMDEPFSHLDKENTAKAARLIAEECAKRGAGFILTDLDDDNHFNYTIHLSL